MDTLEQASEFFYSHAGYSYDPAKQTPEQGRIECAWHLAESEALATLIGLDISWSDDWMVDHSAEFDYSPASCENAVATLPCQCCWTPQVVASLSCIDDADDDYRRVVDAELASEALA